MVRLCADSRGGSEIISFHLLPFFFGAAILCPVFSFAAYSPSAKLIEMCCCVSAPFLQNPWLILSSARAFALHSLNCFPLNLHPRPVSPSPPQPFCRGVGDLHRISFQKGGDQPGPGLGCDVPLRASHLALHRWWPRGWLQGQAVAARSLSCALLGRA